LLLMIPKKVRQPLHPRTVKHCTHFNIVTPQNYKINSVINILFTKFPFV